jgi:predicted P-loop ATPase
LRKLISLGAREEPVKFAGRLKFGIDEQGKLADRAPQELYIETQGNGGRVMIERYGALERGSIDIYRHYPQFTETVKQFILQTTEKMRLPGSATAENYLAPPVLQR